MMYITIAILAVLLISVGLAIYNKLVTKKNQVINTFSGIDVVLKKRFDLLPNLVEIVKNYMQYEADLLKQIVELRSRTTGTPLTQEEKINLDQQLGNTVKGLMVTVENYPDLKANQNFLNLQQTWATTEEQIATARITYNAAVTDYNNAIMSFPDNIIAGMYRFQPYTVLSFSAEERENINAGDLFSKK